MLKGSASEILKGMKRRYKIILLIGAVIVLIRLLVPIGVRHFINQYLEKSLQSYSGQVTKVGISFYKGSYFIEGLRVWKKDRADYDPLLTVDKIEVSLLSHLLLERKILACLDVTHAKLNLIDSVLTGNQQLGEEGPWREVFNKLIPLDLESIKVSESDIFFANRDYQKPVQISLDKIFLSAINIHNSEKVPKKLPGQMNFSVRIQREAWLRGRIQFDKATAMPNFNAKLEMNSINLAKLNNAFILYGPYYFLKDEMTGDAQVLLNEGSLRGHVMPFLKNIEVVKMIWNNRIAKSFLSDSIQALGRLVMSKSMKKAQGQRYVFEGQMALGEEPWPSFWSTLRNGFHKPAPPLKRKKGSSLRIVELEN